MRSMQDYRDEADLLVTASYGDMGVSPTHMCTHGSKSILELVVEVERLRKKLKKKNKKIADLEEKAWMYDELNK